ncbi:ArnT family glycosyltransferase [Halomonas sp. GXIMD04776]|uniref:ArnT family glycosyltransferase n=1 Tax=Halomonas sp. GXIMD04776 TaxID=3415605 RepID=UPI003CB51805
MTTTLFLTFLYLIALGIVFVFSIKYEKLSVLLMVAFVFRCFLLLIDYYNIYPLPGAEDAGSFVQRARMWSGLSFENILSELSTSHSYNYSVVGALLYKIFGYHEMLLPALNLIAGVLVVCLTGAIVYKMWGARAAQWAVFIIAIYPFSAINSATAMREEPSILLFMIGLYFLVVWLREESVWGVYISLFFFALATMVHPGWVGAILGVGAYSIYMLIKSIPQVLGGNRVTKRYFSKLVLSASILVLSAGLAVAGGGIKLGKGISVGTEESEALTEQIESRFVGVSEGGSAYPAVIATGNPITQPWIIPAKVAYFLYAPFPWDIKSPRHIIGLISSFLLFFLTWRIFKGWDNIRNKQECLALLLILASLIIIFSIGVSNIGTGIRHKTKFTALFLILAAASFDTIKLKLRR